MRCPHCQSDISWTLILDTLRSELDAATAWRGRSDATAAPRTERADLLAWLVSWRSEHGLPEAKLSARSTAQLRKMVDEARAGNRYRLGRKWKVGE